MAAGLNFSTAIPHDVQKNHLFLYLAHEELDQCALVCKLWHTFANADHLWLQCFPEIGQITTVNAKKFIKLCAVTSTDQLLKRMRKFISETPPHLLHQFVCSFPCNANYKVSFKLGWGAFDSDYFGVLQDEPMNYTQTCICIDPSLKSAVPEGSAASLFSDWKIHSIPSSKHPTLSPPLDVFQSLRPCIAFCYEISMPNSTQGSEILGAINDAIQPLEQKQANQSDRINYALTAGAVAAFVYCVLF